MNHNESYSKNLIENTSLNSSDYHFNNDDNNDIYTDVINNCNSYNSYNYQRSSHIENKSSIINYNQNTSYLILPFLSFTSF